MNATITSHKADLLTAASVLALYDQARTTPDKLRAGAAMAQVIRAGLEAPMVSVRAQRKPRAGETVPPDVLNAQNLSAALGRICAVVERRNTIPILSCVLLTAEGRELTLAGTDLDMQYREVLSAEVDLPKFQMAVGAHALLAAVRGCRGEVAFRDDTQSAGFFLTIFVGGAETRFPCFPPQDFPLMAEPEKPTSATLDSSALRDPLAFIQSGISADETRYYLCGAHLCLRADADEGRPDTRRLVIEATDGHRLLRDLGEASSFPEKFPDLLIPAKAVNWLVRFLPSSGAVRVEANKARATFHTPRGTITAKMIDGNFPDLQRVIPPLAAGRTTMVVSDAKGAADALRRLVTQSNERNKSVRLTLAGERVEARMRNMDDGQSKANLPGVQFSGPEMEIGLNSNYVRDILGLGVSAEFQMCAMDDPVRINWPDYPGRVGVLMPLRV